MATLSDDQREFEDTRQRLMFSIPELKAAMYDEYYRTITTFAEASAAESAATQVISSYGYSPEPSPAR